MKEDVFVGKFKIIWRPDVLGDWTVIEEHCKASTYTQHLTLNPTDRWLDLGSHIGSFALDIGRTADYVHCVEPEYSNVKLSLRNVSLNPYANVVVQLGAVVPESMTGEVELFKSKKSHSNSIHGEMYNIVHHKDGVFTAPCVHANELIKEHKINKIKLDIEGTEWDILTEIDWSNIDEFIMESHVQVPHYSKSKEIFAHLESQGFKLSFYDDNAPNFVTHGVR